MMRRSQGVNFSSAEIKSLLMKASRTKQLIKWHFICVQASEIPWRGMTKGDAHGVEAER